MKNKLIKSITIGTTLAISFTVLPITAFAGIITSTVLDSKRLAGNSRIDTSLAIATEYNNSTVQNVILTTAYNFPDALSGSVLAQKLNAPILLVGADSENSGVLTYIKNHLSSNGNVYILGGTGVVNDSIANSIRALGFNNITRLNGNDRIETNLKIVSNLNVAPGTPIVIATENNFPDALSISSIAAAKGYPILLSDTSSMSQKTLDTIKTINPSKVYIVGGAGVIGDSVKTNIKSTIGITDDNIIRISGQDRFSTSLAIANYFSADIKESAMIATGYNFPDALSGSVLAAKLSAPIILVDSSDVSQQADFIFRNRTISKLYALGGVGAVSDNAIELMKGLSTTAIQEQAKADFFNSPDLNKYVSFQNSTYTVSSIKNGQVFLVPDATKDISPDNTGLLASTMNPNINNQIYNTVYSLAKDKDGTYTSLTGTNYLMAFVQLFPTIGASQTDMANSFCMEYYLKDIENNKHFSTLLLSDFNYPEKVKASLYPFMADSAAAAMDFITKNYTRNNKAWGIIGTDYDKYLADTNYTDQITLGNIKITFSPRESDSTFASHNIFKFYYIN